MKALEQIDGWPVPQASVAVATPDGVVGARGVTTRQLPIASVSKLLTTYALLLAVEEGAVELDDPVGPSGSTLRHVLSHTSGYAFDGTRVIAEPGRRRIYSNSGFEDAAAHLERASGIPFAGYLREAVLDPLGMSGTDPVGSPAHGFASTVDDLILFAGELLAPKLLAGETLDDTFTVQFPGLTGVIPGVGRFEPCDWGLGVERNFGRPGHWSGEAVPASAGGHFGQTGSFLWVDRPGGLACVCLTGRDFGPWALDVWPPLCTAVIDEGGG